MAKLEKIPLWLSLAPSTMPSSDLLGGKGANLVRLIKAGFPVPGGAVLTTRLFDMALKVDDKILEHIVGQALQEFDEGALWAVRSSAADEDGSSASFAGQHETYLNIRRRDVPQYVRKCWASAKNFHADAYRRDLASQDQPRMAVVLQQMVRPMCAGVLFTRHPVRPDLDRIVVEGVPGLGEALVSGRMDPDRLELARCGGQACGQERPQGSRCLDQVKKDAFISAAQALEKEFGCPQDLEWAYDGQTLWMIQTRPITTLKRPEKAWTRSWGDEFWAEATTDLQYTFLGRWIREDYMEDLARINQWDFLDGVEPFARIHSHVYFNSEYMQRFLTLVPPPLRMEQFFQWIPPYWRAEIQSLGFRRAKLLGNMVRSRLKDKNASLFSHHKKLPAYIHEMRRRLSPRLRDDLSRLDDKALWARLLENDQLGKRHFQFIRWGLASYLLPTKMACAWITEHWTRPDTGPDPGGSFLEMLLTSRSGNLTLETNEELKQLGREAAKVPDLMKLAESGTPSLEQIRAIPQAAPFLASLHAFLDKHGHRGSSRELHFPRWMDDPTLVLGPVLAFAASGAGERKAAEAPDLEKQWLDSIAKTPGGLVKKRLAKRVLDLARAYTQYRENQRYALDFILTDMRHVVLEVGARLAARGLLEKPDDVFFLHYEELGGLWRGSIKTPPGIAGRRERFEADSQSLPPEWIIDDKAYPPSTEPADAASNVLEGTGASPGIARGRARVVRSVGELGAVRQGEILVAPNTDSGWTPVFGLAAGLVVQTGGILSHAAIVAREYGIPAVTGVQDACRIIGANDTVEVNGSTGRVTITRQP